jgi:hypothetical protein
VITDQICYPPLDQLGLGEFQALNAMRWGGITYNDIYFLRRDLACPSRRYQANRLGNLNRPNAAARENAQNGGRAKRLGCFTRDTASKIIARNDQSTESAAWPP